MGLILVEMPAPRGGSPRPRPVAGRSVWQGLANWLVIVGCALGAGYVCLGAAGWL